MELRGRSEGQIEFYNGTDRETLRRLGFASMPLTAEMKPTNAFYSISEERTDLIDHDLLVRYDYAVEALEELPTYQQLDVVRAGHVVTIESSPLSWALEFQSVLSLPYALDLLAPKITAALA